MELTCKEILEIKRFPWVTYPWCFTCLIIFYSLCNTISSLLGVHLCKRVEASYIKVVPKPAFKSYGNQFVSQKWQRPFKCIMQIA